MNARATAAKRPALLLATVSVAALSLIWIASPVLGTQPGPHKVAICHRTASQAHPYNKISVDVGSVNGVGSGDHLLNHVGPVWPASAGDPPAWGDIIPPFYDDGVTLTGYASLNWDAAGQAIFGNGCKFADEVAESESASASESESASASESASESESASASESASGDESVLAGTGTPEESTADTSMWQKGVNLIPTIAFSLILLASLGALAYTNVKAVRSRN